tara:strand:- start:4343 stop:4894 length:552 start_codon:yes stop_codon:yes gene_type:complete
MFGLGLPKKDKINDLNLNQWVKLGDILYNKDKLTINYTCYKDLRKDPFGRLYIIATEGEIVKIGGSQDKGGIESTINAYLRGDIGNSESMRNYAVCKYIKQQLDMGSDVEVWFLPLPIVEVDIPQFSGNKIKKRVSVDFHTIEKSFVDDFYNTNGRYPLLNIQEGKKTWKEMGLSEGWQWKNT